MSFFFIFFVGECNESTDLSTPKIHVRVVLQPVLLARFRLSSFEESTSSSPRLSETYVFIMHS